MYMTNLQLMVREGMAAEGQQKSSNGQHGVVCLQQRYEGDVAAMC